MSNNINEFDYELDGECASYDNKHFDEHITCPGVWLCSHGYLEATVKTLGYFFRTGAMEPRFPLLCHDQFSMEGYFKSVGSLEELERILAAEQVEVTLWQNGRRLAYFLGKLEDVMQAGNTPKYNCAHDINVQLLMKATTAFPGIIAPKVELSAHVGVQDRASLRRSSCSSERPYCERRNHLNDFITPNFELETKHRNRHCQSSSTGDSCFSYLEQRRKQKPVCHSRSTACASPSCCSTQYNQSQSRPQSSMLFEAAAISHKNEERRLSNSSSVYSGGFSNLSDITHSSSSECNHTLSTKCAAGSGGSRGGTTVAKEHQQNCLICQSYKKTFM